MKIEEFLNSLPNGTISGEDVSLSEESMRDAFRLAEMGKDDVFYHLGCGNERGVAVSLQEFGVKRAVGIDSNREKIERARRNTDDNRSEFLCKDIREADISDATVVLFWFADHRIIDAMMEKFASLSHGTRIITVWGPLPGCLPDKVRFPYIINKVPFKSASDLQEQVLAVFGVKCVDFVTAWEFAERYTKALAGSQVRNDRFLTIIQTLTIWINAKNLGVACGDGIPEPIQTYVSIMREHFGIDFGHLLR